jgi:hypothetical protein
MKGIITMHPARKYLQEHSEEYYDGELVILSDERFDEGIMGICRGFNVSSVCYDMDVVMDILMSDGMSVEGAEEFFEFNILGAYVGTTSPVFMYPFDFTTYEESEGVE